MITQKEWQIFFAMESEYREKHIPVVREQTSKLLSSVVEEQKPNKILEIGTAVGYSGIIMLKSCKSSFLTTLDNNSVMCEKAEQNFKNFKVEDRAKIQNIDALEYLKSCEEKFDFIFVDGPKGQYIKYLPYLKQILKIGGTMFCDDVLFYGMIEDESKVIHKKITIVRNLHEFLSKVQDDGDFKSELLQIDDGILISKKIK